MPRPCNRELSRLLADAGLTGCTEGQTGHDSACDGLPGIHIAAKRSERLSAHDALFEARAEAGAKVPIVAWYREGSDPLAVIELSDLLPILRDARTFRRNLERGRSRAHEGAREIKAMKDALMLNHWDTFRRNGYRDSRDILTAWVNKKGVKRNTAYKRARRLKLI